MRGANPHHESNADLYALDLPVELEAQESAVSPKLHSGRFKTTDKLIASLRRTFLCGAHTRGNESWRGLQRQTPRNNIPCITRTRRIVRYGDGDSDLVHQLHQIRFPSVGATAIAATSIGANQQTSGRAIAPSPVQPPPSSDAFRREFCRVVADPHVDHCSIPEDIVDPVGNGLALGPAKANHAPELRTGSPFRPPRPTPIFKGSHKLFFCHRQLQSDRRSARLPERGKGRRGG